MAYLLLLAALAHLSLQQDPVDDFCRRFGHQTAVLGSKLYIDGGQVNYNPLSQYPNNYTNTKLLYNDLTDITGDGLPQLFSNLSKSSYVPDLSGGILWADDVNKIFYQYGGEFSSSAQAFQLWAYDAIYNTWNLTQLTNSNIQRTAWGAGVAVNETAVGYYYGGWQSNTTVPGWGDTPQMSSDLIIYDMIENSWSNNNGPDSKGRAEGVMTFLPASDGGLLIYFGGIEDAGNGTTVGSNMSTIYIFDINSSKWYTQTASGDIPENRRRFCAGAAWPEDQSSYNIYLYGGAGVAPDTAGFDDVYILSLPSFTWIKWWPTEPGPGNPHNGMTCNVIGGTQMLIIGGTFPLDDDCDSANVWGTHNLNLGADGPNKAAWDKYYPNITKYEVPEVIAKQIGGRSSGGATATRPAIWDNRDLPTYFSREASFAPRTATRDIPTSTALPSIKSSSSSNIGAKIGGAVGGAIALIVIVAIIVCCCLRRRKNKREAPVAIHEAPAVRPGTPQELPTHRWSSIEIASEPKKNSMQHSTSPSMMSEDRTPLHSTSPALLGPMPTYANGQQYSHYNPPPHLGALHEHQAAQYSYEQHSPTQYYSTSPVSPNSLLTDSRATTSYSQAPQPYNPQEHALHHQHFPPPHSAPPSTQNTPAQFYGHQSLHSSRFVEDSA